MSMVITILLVVLALALIALLGLLLFFAAHLRRLRKMHDSREQTIGNGPQKALLIFQPSRHESTAQAAQSIAQNLAANGFTVTINYPRPDLPYRWADYSLIALGSPVYVGQVSPLLKYYAGKYQTEGLHFLLFTTGMEPDGSKELTEMASWLGPNNGVDTKKFWIRAPLDATDFVQDSLQNWANSTGPYLKIHQKEDSEN